MSREETCSVMSVVRTVTAEGDSSSRTRKRENQAREERGGVLTVQRMCMLKKVAKVP